MLAIAITLALGCGEQATKSADSPGDGQLDSFTVHDAGRPQDATSVADVSIRDASQTMDIGAPDGSTGVDGGRDATTRVDGEAPVALPDLELLRDKLLEDVWLDEIFVTEDSCAFIEGCVSGTGMRRLLRFSVATANIGEADLLMGRPTDHPDLFEYSRCHEHFHFESYAAYQLRQGDEVAAEGHKQAFCLMDTDRYWTEDPDIRSQERYTCGYQGISRGWADTYGSHLDCQWVDVTGLEVGQYTLDVRINQDRVITELDYLNNDHSVEITIPEFDLAAPCLEGARTGLRRSCGWRASTTEQCSVGDLVEVGCGGCGALGEPCDGAPMMRVCEGEGTQCLPSRALAESTKGCGENPCPHLEFSCPPSGVYTIWLAAKNHEDEYTCTPATRQGPPDLTRPCLDEGASGLERTCGWSAADDVMDCTPGARYKVGCSPGDGVCHVGLRCTGDPMLRVCEGETACMQADALTENDDGCGTQCPATDFICPLAGRFGVYIAPFRHQQPYSCEIGVELIE